MPSESPEQRQKLVAVIRARPEPPAVETNYSDLSPYQRIGSAWNEISNAKQDVPNALRPLLDDILLGMDAVLLQLHPEGTIEPIPLCGSWCRHCGSDHERR